MATNQKFSKEFKEAIVKKLLNRGNQTVLELCKDNNLKLGTVTRWQSICGNVSEMKTKKFLLFC